MGLDELLLHATQAVCTLQDLEGPFPEFTASKSEAISLWQAAEEILTTPVDALGGLTEEMRATADYGEGYLVDPRASILFALSRLAAIQV